jgi:anti-sigma factor (TIGR02949 family)
MNTQPAIDPRCAAILRVLNAFMDGELQGSTSTEVRRHLDHCPFCQTELEGRKELRNRLRTAVSAAQPAPYLRTRVMAQVRAQSQKPDWLQRTTWAGAAAALLMLLVAGGIVYNLGDVRMSVEAQNLYISSLVHRVALIMRPALADHVHCSVFRKYPKQPPSVQTLNQKIGPEYKDLVNAISNEVPADFKVYIAHQCRYDERPFIHVGLHNGSRQISLLLARKKPGESFADSELKAVISGGGLHVYSASAERFHIAGMESDTHLAYVVSDVSREKSNQLMLALSPQIRRTLAGLSG